MLEFLVILVAMVIMAKPRRRRPMGRYIRGNIFISIAGGTLAGNTGILGAANDAVIERSLLSSIVCRYTLSGLTLADDVGPVECGVAHGDYSLTEVEACLELATGWNENDLVSQEIAKRKVRRIGVFPSSGAGGPGDAAVLNDGKAIKTKLNWILNTGQTVNFWMYNHGTAAFSTTDPDLHVLGHANLWPK